MNKAKTLQAKKKQGKKTSKVPVVMSSRANLSQPLAMDGTRHSEFSARQNIYYSKEIIEETRAAFSIERLKSKFADDNRELLAEGERQIHKLWHGIEALTVHNTLFVVLFLLSIGEILNEIRSQLSIDDFVKWRRRVFPPKQERYLQQAQQLAKMGDFAKKYASMGKKRLLIIDKLRKVEDKATYEALFEEHPIPEEAEEGLLDDEEIRQNPFPDSTEDLEGDLLKEHVDALITFHRLKNNGTGFVTFDQAYLIAAFKKNPITIKAAKNISDWLDEKGNIRQKKKWLNILIMNKMVFPERHPRQSAPRDSLNYMLANFVEYCKECDFTDQEWLSRQSELIDDEIVRQSNIYLKAVARKLGVRLSAPINKK
jgi:hypothetical protein